MSDRKLFVAGNFCFMKHPCGHSSHWIRTDRCVAFVKCTVCKADRGELCVGTRGGPTAQTHYQRRKDYTRVKAQLGCKNVKSMTLVVEEEQP